MASLNDIVDSLCRLREQGAKKVTVDGERIEVEFSNAATLPDFLQLSPEEQVAALQGPPVNLWKEG